MINNISVRFKLIYYSIFSKLFYISMTLRLVYVPELFTNLLFRYLKCNLHLHHSVRLKIIHIPSFNLFPLFWWTSSYVQLITNIRNWQLIQWQIVTEVDLIERYFVSSDFCTALADSQWYFRINFSFKKVRFK